MENKNPCLKNHFMKIKFLITPEWLLEWFWSLVKLHAFQCPINRLHFKRILLIRSLENCKKYGEVRKCSFLGVGGGGRGFSYEGEVRKLFFPGGGEGGNFLGWGWYPSAHYVVSATFVLVCFLSLNESTCQTRKNGFYFTSKALFVLEKIKF